MSTRVHSAVIAAVGTLLIWAPLWPFRPAPTLVVVLAAAAAALALAWRVRRHPAPAPVLLLLFWLVIAAMTPLWSAWDETGGVIAVEVRQMAGGAAVSMGFVAATYATPRGLRSWRWSWVTIIVTTVAAGFWEVVTHRHLTEDPFFGPLAQPSATFGNPNNFTCILLLGVGLCLWEVLADPRSWRIFSYGVLGAAAAVMIVLAGSRAGIVLLAAMTLAYSVLTLMHVRRTPRGRGLALFSAAVLLSTVLGAVLFLVAPRYPSLARLAALFTSADRGSDEYRLRLLEYGWRFWRQDPITGVGGGRYESLLHDAWPANENIPHLHNAALELLTEFGLPPAVLAAALVVVVAARLFRRPVPGRGRPAGHHDVRPFLATTLVALGYGAVIIDSALAMLPWWLVLATAVSLADVEPDDTPGADGRRLRRQPVAGPRSRTW